MGSVDRRLNGAWWVLRVAIGVGMFLAGLDKFFDVLTTWSMYLSPLAERLLPVKGATFLRAVGIIEMAIGLAVLTRYTRAGAYAAAAWLLGIAVNLAVTGSFWDLVVRDAQNAVAAFALGHLSGWRQEVAASGAAAGSPEAPRQQVGQGAKV